MKNTIYAFLLGVAVSVGVVGLVAFKNDVKVEKEQMIILAEGKNAYWIHTNLNQSYTEERVVSDKYHDLGVLLNKIHDYERDGWVVTSTNRSLIAGLWSVYFYLERDKK